LGEITGFVIIGFGSERTVACKASGSDKQSKFTTETGIHFPGLTRLGPFEGIGLLELWERCIWRARTWIANTCEG